MWNSYMYNSLPPLFLFSASSPTSSSLLPPSPPHLSAQAFHDAFGDFIAWLRDTELKIQRDDPLKLEVEELKTGVAYLQVRPAEYGRVSLIPRPGYIPLKKALFWSLKVPCCLSTA